LDERLSATAYLAGDSFSVADITAMIATDFMKPARLAIPEEALHFKRWYAQVSSRPSHKA
jgi:glutathione S-transferase